MQIPAAVCLGPLQVIYAHKIPNSKLAHTLFSQCALADFSAFEFVVANYQRKKIHVAGLDSWCGLICS